MASNPDTHRQGSVKDPGHDGRLKENREEGRTKGTTPGSQARAKEHGNDHEEDQRGRGRAASGESHAPRSSGQHASGKDQHAPGNEPKASHAQGDRAGERQSGSIQSTGNHAKHDQAGGSHAREDDAPRRQESQGAGAGDADDLKSREYKDAKGEVHHHTRTYMEQHKGE